MGPAETIAVIISIAGCFVGLAGWLSGRDKKIIGDAEWRGQINAKLDSVVAQGKTIDKLDGKLDNMTERLVSVESSAKQAHKRLDALEDKKGQ